MLSDIDLELSYNSGEADLISAFYIPCLEAARSFDRAAGYFRSSVYHLVGVALSDFAISGGMMRLVCSPALAEEDIRAISTASEMAEAVSNSLADEIETVLSHPQNRAVVELLATLVANGSLEVRIAYKPGNVGIFHNKMGIFSDVDSSVSFTGSANETFMAWDPAGNHEGFDTFASWRDGESLRIRRHQSYFANLWAGLMPGLVVAPLPDVPLSILRKYENHDGVDAAIERARHELRTIGRTRWGPRRELQPHQAEVVASWEAAGYRGIIDHVTGAGKTVSALEVIRKWLMTAGNAAAVLVPSDLLLSQWQVEIERELAELSPRVLVIGGSSPTPAARDSLNSFTTRSTRPGARIVLSTIQSASSDNFLNRVVDGSHLLVVADEVHRVGSRHFRKVLDIDSGGRLGLSATPQRYGDATGTALIFDYFGDTLEPHVGIADAQKAGRLVPYDYHVSVVELTRDEATNYQDLTKRIAIQYSRQNTSPSADDDTKIFRLRLQRAKIVKKAERKLDHAIDIVGSNFRAGDHWLVYCEDQPQLNQVMSGLHDQGHDALEYHSAMLSSKPTTLRYFESYGGILVSIKCLDEGVDLPFVNRALILASSSNSREYIQRRGRVLRTAPSKYSADIFDVLVGIEVDHRITVLKQDLKRARAFASTARNDSCRYELDSLESDDLDDVSDEYEENDDDGSDRDD